MAYQFEPTGFDGRTELLGDRRQAEKPPQRVLTVMAALAVMTVFAAGLWFAYYIGTRHAAGSGTGDVPLIRADARPMMVRPAQPGGLRIPDRNMLIYNPDERMVEHLLPPPERPMARPMAADGRSGAAASPTANAAAVVPAAGPAARIADRTQQAGAASPLPEKAHGTAAAQDGVVRLQLGSVRSAGAARFEWGRIRQKNSDLLGSLSATPVRSDLGDKGVYYRIQTGPLGDRAAERICGALRQRKIGCIIVR
jgi:hypothetical protein